MPTAERNKLHSLIVSHKPAMGFSVQLFADKKASEVPTELHVLPFGKWDHPVYGEFTIDDEVVQMFIANFQNKLLRKKIPITAGHDGFEESPAVGWFEEVYARETGLYAKVTWTQYGEELLLSGGFKYFSPEYYTEYRDPADGKLYKYVLVGGALTNKPFFRELDDILQSFSEKNAEGGSSVFFYKFNDLTMNLEDILAKDPAELSDEEAAFLKENAAELTDEQREAFGVEVEAEDVDTDLEGDGEDGAGDNEGADDESDEGTEEGEGDDGPVEASEMVSLSAKQFSTLKKQAEAGMKAFQELEARKTKEAAGKLVFSSSNKSGRFAPKQANAVASFMETLNDKQRDQFTSLVNNMPKQAFSTEEIGSDAADVDGDPAKVFSNMVAQVQKDSKLSFKEAFAKVAEENPELHAEYMASRV